MKMEIAKGGWRMDRPQYQLAVAREAMRLIAKRRPMLIIPKDAERGARFNSNSSVMARLESNYTEEEFMACPALCVDNMLLDAAKSDFWYNHEKDWGWPEVDAEEEDIDYEG